MLIADSLLGGLRVIGISGPPWDSLASCGQSRFSVSSLALLRIVSGFAVDRL